MHVLKNKYYETNVLMTTSNIHFTHLNLICLIVFPLVFTGSTDSIRILEDMCSFAVDLDLTNKSFQNIDYYVTNLSAIDKHSQHCTQINCIGNNMNHS